jgi:hypothetical protein
MERLWQVWNCKLHVAMQMQSIHLGFERLGHFMPDKATLNSGWVLPKSAFSASDHSGMRTIVSK